MTSPLKNTTNAPPAADAAAQPALKKARTEPPVVVGKTAVSPMTAEEVTACLADGLLEESNVAALAAAYKTSSPYLHTCIPALANPALLRAVRKEIEDNLVFTEKETDIYKVLQTGDLANIDGLPEDERQRLASLHRLRNALYSDQFREFVSRVTGCGPLSPGKQDLSINSYCQGSHLLNHDDVIGSRRVSYILYLPDPEDWDPTYGGSLELYPCVAKGTPDVDPTLTIPVKWNQFVMFTVQPGYSFHSVQEVVAPHDRLSISGWFHVPQAGEPGYEAAQAIAAEEEAAAAPASLAQLEDDSRDAEYPFRPLPAAPVECEALSDADRAYLGQFLSADYLRDDNLAQINARFGEDSSVQLQGFLLPAYAELLRPVLDAADNRDGVADGQGLAMRHGTGVHAGWRVQGSPVKQRFMVLSPAPVAGELEEATKLRELQGLFESEAFCRWTHMVAGLALTHQRGRARRFRPGLDYTLGTSSTVTAILDVSLSLTPPHASWDEGERGGYECYIAGDENNDDPAIYRAAASEDSDTLLATQAAWNVLTIVLRDQGVMRFVKYVSALANGSRWDLSYEFLARDDGQEDETDGNAPMEQVTEAQQEE